MGKKRSFVSDKAKKQLSPKVESLEGLLSGKDSEELETKKSSDSVGKNKKDNAANEKPEKKIREVWYCPEKLHESFRNYAFQKNMKKTDVVIKAIQEMLKKEGF